MELFRNVLYAVFFVFKLCGLTPTYCWNFRATTLYDRPPEHFCTVAVDETHTMMNKYPEMRCDDPSCTNFTALIDGEVVLREDRPGLLVSSTSWTEDEDFLLLLSALKGFLWIKYIYYISDTTECAIEALKPSCVYVVIFILI